MSSSIAGELKIVTGADPAAGAEVLVTVPAGKRWLLRSIEVQLVTDATVANRRVRFLFDDGTTEFCRVAAFTDQTASQTFEYVAAPVGGLEYSRSGVFLVPIPPLMLGPGHRVQTSTNGIVAGDDFGAPALLVQEWDDARLGYRPGGFSPW